MSNGVPNFVPLSGAEGRQSLIINPIDFPVQASLGTSYNMIGFVSVIPSYFLASQAQILAAATSATITFPTYANLYRIKLNISGNATLATAGPVTITVTFAGNTIFSDTIYVPAAALGVANLWDENLDFNSTIPALATATGGTAGELIVTLSGALATGTLSVNAYSMYY